MPVPTNAHNQPAVGPTRHVSMLDARARIAQTNLVSAFRMAAEWMARWPSKSRGGQSLSRSKRLSAVERLVGDPNGQSEDPRPSSNGSPPPKKNSCWRKGGPWLDKQRFELRLLESQGIWPVEPTGKLPAGQSTHAVFFTINRPLSSVRSSGCWQKAKRIGRITPAFPD
jgi:hypothetical protein